MSHKQQIDVYANNKLEHCKLKQMENHNVIHNHN